MKTRMVAVFLTLALLGLAFPASAVPAEVPSRVIVTFDGDTVNHAALTRIEKLGGVKVKELPMIGGAVVMLPNRAATRAAAGVPGVSSVEYDSRVSAQAKSLRVQPPQALPWGIARVRADQVWASATADPVKVAVVDTGIDPTHPDLAANIKGGMSALDRVTSYKDDNGHGTHVAGTIAALNNSIGVVGVGPAADLYAVKVLDRKGSGWVSDIIEGLQWCVANDMDVVNMSLGSSAYSVAFAEAVQATLDEGVVIVAAAGNSGPGYDTVQYPGAYPGVIAVSATDSSDLLASFSSRGPQVSLAAPGVSVRSTYKGATYATLSGTSMASPHVAGVAALVVAVPPNEACDADGDGAWDPSEVRAKLIASTDDLGAPGFDVLFGYGLVRADLALAP